MKTPGSSQSANVATAGFRGGFAEGDVVAGGCRDVGGDGGRKSAPRALSRSVPPRLIYAHALMFERVNGAGRIEREVMLCRTTWQSVARQGAKKRAGFVRVVEVLALTREQFEALRAKMPPAGQGWTGPRLVKGVKPNRKKGVSCAE